MTKQFRALLCMLLCMAILGVGGCACAESGGMQLEGQKIVESTDEEIGKAIDLGLVPAQMQGNYEETISYKGFCAILDCFVEKMFPELFSDWKDVSANYRDADVQMSRMEGALVLLYAAECCGIDAVGYEYNIPLEDLIADDVDFYEGVTWDYPLLPDILETYYNETIANSQYYTWRCESNYGDNAILFAEYMSYGNGKTFLDYDERYALNLGDMFKRGDAIRAVERLYENARFAQYGAAEEAACTVSDAAITLGKAMEEVSWQQLPNWKGFTVSDGTWTAAYGAGMRYQREEIEALSTLGFNFVRAPLNTAMLFKNGDTSMVNLGYLEEMDNLIKYCAEMGIHVCFDLHDIPEAGYITGDDTAKIILWQDAAAQALFVEFWQFLAEYYRDIPSNLLSFNLLNEPRGADGEPDDALYSEIMLRAIDAIREVTPERLIFADALGVTEGRVVEGLADAQIVQALHPYFLTDGSAAWPVYAINGFIHQNSGVLTFNGAFPAGTKITAEIVSVHGDNTFYWEADGERIAALHLGTDAVGENGCSAIWEEGTDGEYRDYDGAMLTGELTQACEQIQLTQDGWWYSLRSVCIEMDTYRIAIIANGNLVTDEAVPNLTIDAEGIMSAEDEGTLVLQNRAWLETVFDGYRTFTQETGTQIMVQEFGFNQQLDYQATLAAADDFLDVLDEYGIAWCTWCGEFGPLRDRRECEWYELWDRDAMLRKGARQEMITENWMIDAGLMEVFSRHMQ